MDESAQANQRAILMKQIQDELSAMPGVKFLGFQEIEPSLLRFEHENRPSFIIEEHPDKPGLTYADWIAWFTEQLRSQQVGGHTYFLAFRPGRHLSQVYLDDSYQWVRALFQTGQKSFGLWSEDLSFAVSFGMYVEANEVRIVKRDAEKWQGPDFESQDRNDEPPLLE
jgi:hypothetical protein